jgi:phosphoribosylamine--glycine ligase
MKFRLVSKSGDGIGLAHRLAQEGHAVDFWLKDPDGPNLYKGILPRVDRWQAGLSTDTILVFDMVGAGGEADEYRAKGFSVVGGSKIADQLELDRGFGLDVAGNHGIEIPTSEDFQDFDKAIAFLEDKDGQGWVFKPEGNKEGVTTFVSQSPEQMIAMLQHFAELWKGKVDFILQEVVDGVEISSEVWVVDGRIVPGSYNNTLEQKRFCDGDLGPNTGCMGSTVKFNLCPRLYEETFGKLVGWLGSQKYSGPLDINCIVDWDGRPHMLEWTARFGYSAIYAMIEGLGMPLGEFLAALAAGEAPDLNPSSDWLGALRLTIPPYPHVEEAPECEGIPILGLDPRDEHTWPLDVMLEGEALACSGFDGIICEVSGAAMELDSLWQGLYARAREIQIPEVQYRTDHIEDVTRRVNELADLGYCDSLGLVKSEAAQ